MRCVSPFDGRFEVGELWVCEEIGWGRGGVCEFGFLWEWGVGGGGGEFGETFVGGGGGVGGVFGKGVRGGEGGAMGQVDGGGNSRQSSGTLRRNEEPGQHNRHFRKQKQRPQNHRPHPRLPLLQPPQTHPLNRLTEDAHHPQSLHQRYLPLNTAVINLMRNTIENVIQCHLDDYELLPVVEKLEVPLMIICSKEDEVVGYEHAEMIYGAYGGRGKELVFVEGGHTGERGEEVVGRVVEFVGFVGKKGREREREEGMAKGKGDSRQRDEGERRDGEGKGGSRKSGVFNKRTSPQKNQT